MPAPPESLIHIGECRFDPASHELWRDGGCTRLPRRLSQLLLRLAQAAPAVVGRQTLIDEVWQRRMVEDDVLSRAIAELRRALDDDTRTPRYIETIPKAGYRLCAPVRFGVPDAVVDTAVPDGQLVAIAPDRTVSSAPSAPAAPSPSPSARRFMPLAFVAVAVAALSWLAWRGGASHGLSSADMARLRPLTSAPGWESRPDVSSDGRWVAYSESDPQGGVTRLVLQDIDGGHREVLEESPQFNLRPEFENGGARLVFVHVHKGRCELRLRSIPGGPGRTLTECAADAIGTPAWSYDRRRIAFTAPAVDGHAPGLALLDVDTGEVQPLTTPTLLQGADRDPEWVPGDRAITFARGPDGEQHLMRIAVAPVVGTPVALIDGGRLQGHAWSADGTQLLIATDQPGYRTLALYDADARLIEVLNARGARYPAWADNGELVVESAQYDANIWRLSLDTPEAAPEKVIASTRYDASPALSADGSRLAFVSTRNDFEQIFVAAVDGRAQQKLPMPDGQRWSRPSFSPDGAFLLVTGYDERNRHWLYRHALATARTEILTALGEEASAGRYRSDGTTIVYQRRSATGERSLWQAPAADAPGAPIAGSEHVVHFDLAGDDIVLRRADARGFFLLRAGAARPDPILADVDPITDAAWTVRGRHLYAAVVEGDAMVLKRYDIDRGAGELIARDIDATAVGPSLAVSADERALWFARTDSVSVDLMRLPPSPR
jgi:Tol biopolymer transport system component/DNA-binding winged helix-turn-helix (wHTH) protein